MYSILSYFRILWGTVDLGQGKVPLVSNFSGEKENNKVILGT